MTPATKTRWLAPFAATLFAMLTLQMSSLGFSPLLPAIQRDFKVSYSQLGLFTGLYGIVAIALSYPAGLLSKRFGEKRVLAAGLLVVAAGLLGLSLATDFEWGLLGRVIWLSGYRLAFVCVMTAIAVTAPPAWKGSSMGILGATSALASVIGAPFGSAIGGELGWRRGVMAYAAMALAGAVVFGVFYRSRRESVAPVLRDEPSAASAVPAYRVPVVWALAILLGCSNAGGFSSTFFVPSALKSSFGLNALSAAYVISGAYIFTILANLVCGFLIDRFNRWIVMGSFMAITIFAALAMTSSNLLIFRVAVTLVIGLGSAAANQVYGIGGEVMRGREVGPAIGIVSLGAGVFGYAGPQMLGWLRDRTGGFNAGWYFIAFTAAAALIEIVLLHRKTMRPPDAAMQNRTAVSHSL